ncbi:MAG: hypothetical protein WCL06_01575 [Bacteroidota bacterium]
MEDKYGYAMLSDARVIKTGENFDAELAANTFLAGLFDTLHNNHIDEEKMAIKLDVSTKEFTKEGVAIRDKAAFEFSIAASVASGYGTSNNISVLVELNKYTNWFIRKCTLDDQLIHCKKILQVLGGYTVGLATAGLNAAFITTLTEDITQMEALTLIPQDMIDAHKALKIQFVDHMGKSKEFLDKQMDKAMELYRITNVPFYLLYTASRKARHHHRKRKLPVPDPEATTGILELMVLFKESMDAAAGVSFIVPVLNISQTTDEDGEIYCDQLVPGTYTAKLTMDGYKSIEFEFTIEAAKTNMLQFLMEKL